MASIIHHTVVPTELLLDRNGAGTGKKGGLAVRISRPKHREYALAVLDMDQLSLPLQSTLAVTVCTTEEQRRVSAFRHRKRKREWLAGRLAAKTAARLLLSSRSHPGPVLAELEILPDAQGRPLLQPTDGATEIYLSISHSHRFGAAMACLSGSCGVDIQKVLQKIKKVRDYFSSRDERALLAAACPDDGEAARLTMLWAAKEALKKRLLLGQPPLFRGIALVDIRRRADGRPGQWLFGCSLPGDVAAEVEITVLRQGEYILAFCREERPCLNCRKWK